MNQSFKATPKQIEATELHAAGILHVMLGGGSRSGKTFICIRNIIARALKKPSRHLIGRYRFNHAKTSIWHDTLPKVLHTRFPELPVKWNNSDFYIEFPNGSQIWLGGLDDKKRTEKVLGNEYSTIYLNECSQIEYDAVMVVLTRLAENSGLKNLMMYDCNPPSTAHWIYKLFIKKLDPRTEEPLKRPKLYTYLQMNPIDNYINLPPHYIDNVLGTLSERERLRFLDGQFLNDIEGALWKQDWIFKAQSIEPCEERVTAIGVDPAVTNNEDSAETGIIVAASNGTQANVIKDYSLKASPEKWGQTVVNAYHKHQANCIVVEVNQGGDLVESLIKSIDKTVKIVKVRASKGKFARAEPVSAMYERGEVYHAKGLGKLEDQLVSYVPINSTQSPDRLDAMVWVLTYLVIDKPRERRLLIH